MRLLKTVVFSVLITVSLGISTAAARPDQSFWHMSRSINTNQCEKIALQALQSTGFSTTPGKGHVGGSEAKHSALIACHKEVKGTYIAIFVASDAGILARTKRDEVVKCFDDLLANGSCVTTNGSPRGAYTLYWDTAIPFHNDMPLTNRTRSQCMAACDGYNWCRSFEFVKPRRGDKGDCQLSKADNTTAKTKASKNIELYVKKR